MIKVLQVITDTNIGGAGIWLLNYLKEYDRDQILMAVVLPEDSLLKKRIEALGVRVIEAEGIADESFSIEGVRSLVKIFKEEAPNVVHTHASLSARIAAKLLKIKVIHTRHCIEDKKNFIVRFIYKIINNALSDSVIAVSKTVYENLIDDGIKKSKLSMVYNGITPLEKITDIKKTATKYKYKIPEGKTVVGIVARLEAVKNHRMFLDSAKVVATMCPETCFLVVGDGSLEEQLKEYAKEIGVFDKVIFTGYIEDVNDIMNVIDIAVLTSYKEALSISLLEAMSLEKCIVSTASGGPEELIKNGENGMIVNVGDVLNLTMAIVHYIKNPEARKIAGEKGKRIVSENFLSKAMARKIEDIYFDLKG